MKTRFLVGLRHIAFVVLAITHWAAYAAETVSIVPSTVPNIVAASDLKFALPEVADAFTAATGKKLNLNFGASGVFRRQIAEGAPFEMYLSADEAYVEALYKEQRTEDAGKLYAIGRLTLYLPKGSLVKADKNLRDLVAAAKDGRLKHLAIANPETAPYGRAAREALKHVGAWEAVESKLVLGENVAQAARFATSGSAQAALLPHSLVIAPELSKDGAYITLPESWHARIRQRMVLVKGAGETARAFYAFMQTEAAQAILKKYGFEVTDKPVK